MGDTNQAVDTPAVLHGGRGSVAHFNDGRHEEVFVRCPTLRKLERYLEIADDIPALLEFCCEKEEGWADRLTDASAFDLYAIARSINDPRLGPWLTARRQTAAALRAALGRESPSPASPPGP